MKRYGTACPGAVSFFLLAAFAAGLLLISGPVSANDSCDVGRVLEAAHSKKLHGSRYWHILMHYEKKCSGVVSQVDDPDFFLAPDGKRNPGAELDATIRYLFGDTADPEKAVCRFYARYRWLEEELGGCLTDCFAGRSCPEIDRIDPKAASLVFPTYYLNNPASMFGHTLITIDTAYTSKHLSNAVNYAAFTEGGEGISLAVSGLTGLYRGYYSVMPYYEKIQEYSDINQRDIWEYELNLSPPELRRMVWHIREMDQIYSDYYFFDENCSYNLLYLLEAARPSANLVDRFHIAAIPIDTIKAADDAGLLGEANFRPAKTTLIRYLAGQLGNNQIETVLALVNGRISAEHLLAQQSLSRREKIRILDLTVEVIQYRYVKKDISQPQYRRHLLAALKARSRLGSSETDWASKISVPPQPEQGHDSKRASMGVGLEGGDLFYELRFRPALTDLTDMDYIPQQGAQIEFGDLRTRYYPEHRRLLLDQAELIDIVSISPMSAFSKPLSWKANTGWHRKPLENDDNALYYRLNGGIGLSGQYSGSGLCYLMAEAELNIGGDIENDYAFGGGASAGTIFTAGRFCRIHLYGRVLRFFMGGPHTDYTAGGISNFKICRNHHLSVEARYEEAGSDRYEISTMWHWFF